MEGEGELDFNNGKKYIGEFQRSLMHGRGMIVSVTEANSVYESGIWREGKLVESKSLEGIKFRFLKETG